ncbi:hypothetical protein TUM17567_33950 [Citrobacter amalonaticus]|nr:hypothetical protein TUM17567_33950 [Citrobacter amalonaticus]
MSENTINKALRKMGYDAAQDICGHGFRTLACSALIESGLWSEDAVELQMSHKESNSVRAAYTHYLYFIIDSSPDFCSKTSLYRPLLFCNRQV